MDEWVGGVLVCLHTVRVRVLFMCIFIDERVFSGWVGVGFRQMKYCFNSALQTRKGKASSASNNLRRRGGDSPCAGVETCCVC